MLGGWGELSVVLFGFGSDSMGWGIGGGGGGGGCGGNGGGVAGLLRLMLNKAWIRESKLKLAEEVGVDEVVGPAKRLGPPVSSSDESPDGIGKLNPELIDGVCEALGALSLYSNICFFEKIKKKCK